jgi:hypothetical protein
MKKETTINISPRSKMKISGVMMLKQAKKNAKKTLNKTTRK